MTVYINGVAQVDGGFYGINVETLTGNKTLTPGVDKMYQYLDEGGADRIITLATAGATASDRFIIRHNGAYDDTHYLEVKQAAVSLDKIYAGAVKEFIFDGTNWTSRGIGTGENDLKRLNITIGKEASAYNTGIAIGDDAVAYADGIAIGLGADAYSQGVAVGRGADGFSNGVGIGRYALGANSGVAIGSDASSQNAAIAIGQLAIAYKNSVAIGQDARSLQKFSIAIGHYSQTYRAGETSININGDDTDQENNVVQGRWERTTTDNTPVEIFCAGDTVGTERFIIRPSSVLAFTMLIVARDNVADEVARYSVLDGLIKRDAAGNTTMVLCTVTVDHEDDATWDIAVTADDANEALIITVTGDAANPVQWAAVMDGVETHF